MFYQLEHIQQAEQMDNTTCITTTEEANELLSNGDVYVLLLQGAALTMIEVLGAVMNIFVMIVILANKELRTRPYMLSLQIVIMNILISLSYTPPALTGLYREWLFGETFCIFYGTVFFLIASWRWPVMCLLILDRFLTVFFPFCYRRTSKRLMISLLTCTFLIILLLSVIPLFDLIAGGCYTFKESHLTCKISWECTNTGCKIYSYSFTMAIFAVGGIAPVIMYIAMYIKGRKARKILMSLPTNENSTSMMSTLEQKSENRARITVLVMFINLICLTLPVGINWLLERSNISVTAAVQYLLRDISYCLPISDAFIILQNKDIKSALKKMAIRKRTSNLLV